MSQMAHNWPLHAGVKVIATNADDLVALAKPAGVLSHPNASADEGRALLTCSYALDDECYVWRGKGSNESQPQRAWLLNRLDGATSGVILLAGSLELARHIRQHFKHRQVQKIYAALVFGRPGSTRSTWRDRLVIGKQGGQVRASTRGNIPAETRMQRVDTSTGSQGTLSLLQLEPKTGRSHQLRVQCAHRKLPIVGDATYGDFRRNREFARQQQDSRLFLHSFRTSFSYEWRGQHRRFQAEAPLPEAFSAALTR
jgi:23S rRNA-/tRNA-specific pseudouridylate synthase